MDAIISLDTVGLIVNATRCISAIISASQFTESRSRNNENVDLGTVTRLKLALSEKQMLSGSDSRLLDTSLPLQDMSSSRDACITLLENMEFNLRRASKSTTAEPDTRDSLLPQRDNAYYEREIDRLNTTVTRQVTGLLNSRLSQLSQSLKVLESQGRYARPEQESQVDVMSSDLEDLRSQMNRQLTDSHASYSEADVKQLKVLLTRLTKSEHTLLADTIVSSLNYTSRPARLDSIPKAHQDTFQWAFDSRLSDWFVSGGGTFWVSGKPGSGKSTFMKFIANHPRTRELLEHWAGSSSSLAVASHCFWIAGTPIQKSWQGLLQSLLYDLLHGHPDVVSIASPHRWAAAKAGRWQTAAEPWSVFELAAALRSLSTADHVPLKICFFIDGLDEYDSNHAELCQVLLDMAKSPHIKMCLSSRRWPVFERSFGQEGQESLDIHELTKDDIRKFVYDQLRSDPRWSLDMSANASLKQAELADRIVAQADGVFLWAFFVTRSLQEGLSNGERLENLAARFSRLPSDLDHLFQHMLDSVNPADHCVMAGILLGAIHALEPLHVDIYWQLERELEDVRSPSGETKALNPDQNVVLRREKSSNSINEKTKGLLKLVNNRVEFLHRTVKDFVSTKDIGEYLQGKLPAGYNGFISIATAYLGFLKATRHDNSLVAGIIRQGRGLNSGPFVAHLNQALLYASEALKQTEQPGSSQSRQVEKLLDEYEAAIVNMARLGQLTVRGVNSGGYDPRILFREELLRHDLAPYLAKKTRQMPDFFDVFDESPLYAALMPMSRSSGESAAPAMEVLEIILRRGEDPNSTPRELGIVGDLDAPSPWVAFSRSTMSVFNMLSGPCMFPAKRWNDSLKNATFSRLLSHGADPNKPLLDRPGARTVFSHFLDISLSKFLDEECFEDYPRTLDAFLRAGASLGVPELIRQVGSTVEAAFGNLARRHPEESILASFCNELKGLTARLAADPPRATFTMSVLEKLIQHCRGREEDLSELKSAILQGCPAHVSEPLAQMIASEITRHPGRGSELERFPKRLRRS
ncbi:hypothetical protein CABS01_08924 [Colletotrichum abscissum]|uniref:Nephrocystin 3-like N-terminal domain-containing protein n=1 Tax=Colletotrichum abscissum TaxID=1671311 RepID=A0A9Q0ATJ2_9PEZI|nr:uncharacterized protein CABS01_08924 [Colletotrichum abscissum]KAI3530746.1 hypothetical protein CABS02_14397 [Colletotrichum abscissum]KAK1503535.1 hypothetical protein CABS01_08924 [Colletotrichum abscissum]